MAAEGKAGGEARLDTAPRLALYFCDVEGVAEGSMQGKTIIVTGAFGALGGGVAAAAADRGASVAALDIGPTAPPALAERLGKNALLLGGVDLSSLEGATKAIAGVKEKFGRLDALLNIAGGFQWETVEDGKPEAFDRMFALNLKTALNATKAALPYLIESGAGRIVNVGAQSALHGASGFGAYAASKSAVHRLTESLADELKLRGVTVNAVLPSTIDTPANRRDMPKADFDRWVKPADLAAVMLFLASDEAKVVTGALIPVSGRV
jgi:NAD(P)-dependent dehydrogenase (short-subunit alcohol dehydrogenase family)